VSIKLLLLRMLLTIEQKIRLQVCNTAVTGIFARALNIIRVSFRFAKRVSKKPCMSMNFKILNFS